MEVQLENLINRIKDEGIRTAEERAEIIVRDAEEKAARIIADARQEADNLIKKGESDAARREASGRESLKQAHRDTLIALRSEITALLDGIVKSEAARALQGDSLADIITSVIKNWKPENSGSFDLILPESDASHLQAALRSALAEKMKQGIEIKPSGDLKAGFRISGKDGEWFYDFTDEELAEVLSARLSGSVVKAMEG